VIERDLPKDCMGVDPRTVRGPTAFGCDVRPGSWDLIIGGVETSSTTKIPVIKPLFTGKVRDEADVIFFLRQYKVRFGVIDTRPETTLAKRLQLSAREHGIKVWRAEYNTAPSVVEVQENEGEGVLKLDRTMTLDNVHYSFVTGLSVILPQNWQEVTKGSFKREMTSSTRIPTMWQGKPHYSWDHVGDDHSFHAFNYLLVAVKKGNLLSFGSSETLRPDKGLVASSRSELIVEVQSNKGGYTQKKRSVDWEAIDLIDGMKGRVSSQPGMVFEL
jgi:hypothetical protein